MRQIITLGGGGFSMEPNNLALDKYILARSGKPRPNVCFVPTASGDSERYMLNFYRAFSTLNCNPRTLHLFPMPPTRNLEEFVLAQDVIYVGGGSVRNLVALWREWKLDIIFRKALDSGILLCGISAGMNCWFEQCITDSISPELDPFDCLGFLPGSACPHYDGEPLRKPRYRELIEQGALKSGFAADDNCAIHWVDEKLYDIVASSPGAHAYECGMHDGVYKSTQLSARLLPRT